MVKIHIKKNFQQELTEEFISDDNIQEEKEEQRKEKYVLIDNMIIDRLFYEINEIKKSINDISLNMNNKIPILIDVKKETINIDTNKIKVALSLANTLGDIIIFKEYYMKNGMKPIKSINKMHYEYWCDGKWNRDEYGRNIINIIACNLQSCYIKINTVNNYDLDQFIKNQQHIFALSDTKYKADLLREIQKQINS